MHLKPDLEISRALAQDIVFRAVPDRTVAAVTRIHGGVIAAIHQVTFADGEPSLIIKIYPQSLHWKLRKEVGIIDLIAHRLSIPVPRIVLIDDSKQKLPLDLVVMTRLEGSPLGSLEPALAPEALASAYRQIGSLLREFHQIAMPAFGYLGATGIATPHHSNETYLTWQFARKLAEFRERGGAEPIALRLERHFNAHRDLLRQWPRPVLCHNDLHAGNLLARIEDGNVRLTGVLDFENALAGDPLMDIAKAAYYLKPHQVRALLDGYGPIARASVTETLALYHLYFTLELWCWMTQIGDATRANELTLHLEQRISA